MDEEFDMSQVDNLCVLAVPKKGRLFEKVEKMLDGIGLQYQREARQDIAFCRSFPLKIVFLPAKDIACFVGDGNVDVGITGQDMVAESNVKVDEILSTGFGRCQLAVQAPIATGIKDPKELLGKRIATSFPFLTEKYFKQIGNGENMPSIRVISGSVEAACGLGLADAVVDLVETGTTMRAAGLEIVGSVLKTEAVVVSNLHSNHQKTIETLKKRIQGYLLAKQHRMMYYNIPREQLENAAKITPGAKKPTVTPLADESWLSVGAMVLSVQVNNIMDALHELGATDIFVVDLLNCRT